MIDRPLSFQPSRPMRIMPLADPAFDGVAARLEDRIKLGASLFRKVIQTHLDRRDQAFAAWRAWAIGLRDLLYESDELPSVVSLMMALAKQGPRDWNEEQLGLILGVLSAWTQSPRPTRQAYEAWEDALVDGEIHVSAW